MAFTSKKATRLILMAVLSAAVALPAEIRFEARYKKRPGTMTVDDHAISFQGVKKDSWRWAYPDIDELKLGEHAIRVTAGRTYEFRGDVPAAVYELWKDHLDQRFVAELADHSVQPEWRIGVKHRIRRTSADGVLEFGRDRIVFASGRTIRAPGASPISKTSAVPARSSSPSSHSKGPGSTTETGSNSIFV